MPITYHIGRLHPETLPIPERHAGVSREHCRITIQDNGEWYLEDTNSTRGTYVVNPDGSLTRVSCMRISPTTKIQLGQADVSGFTFLAAVVNKDYRSAWKELRAKLEGIETDEAAFKKRVKRMSWLTRSAGILGCLVGMIRVGDSQSQLLFNRICMILSPILVGILVDVLLNSDPEKFRRRRDELVCPNPNCRKPLSKYYINYGECPFCKCCATNIPR